MIIFDEFIDYKMIESFDNMVRFFKDVKAMPSSEDEAHQKAVEKCPALRYRSPMANRSGSSIRKRKGRK